MPIATGVVMTGVIVAAALIVVVVAWFLLAIGPARRCDHCEAALTDPHGPCPVCGAPQARYEAHPGAEPYGYGEPEVPKAPEGTRDPEVGYMNAGISRRIVQVATAAMVLGLAVRVVGMAPAAGVDLVVPSGVLALLSIAGGIVAFIGFVVLDAA